MDDLLFPAGKAIESPKKPKEKEQTEKYSESHNYDMESFSTKKSRKGGLRTIREE